MENRNLKRIFVCTTLTIGLAVLSFVGNHGSRDWVRSTNAYWTMADKIATPMLRRMDAEKAHAATINLVQKNYAPLTRSADAQSLQTTVWGLNFSNPLGIAAGFDKQAQAMRGLLQMGFGFVEVGGVTPEPQEGNPKPRMFRLAEDKAVINRYGLNSDGQAIVAARLANFKTQTDVVGIVGVNIAKNTTSNEVIEDYRKGVRNLGNNVDFIVLNVSCPNVAWTKQLSADGDEMSKMVCAVKEERDQLLNPKTPLLIKLGPDMSDETKQHMAHVATTCGIDGLIVANTSSERGPDLQSGYSKEMGGLSGQPIKAAALQSVRDMYKLTNGKIPIIGVGGIESGQDAYERIRAGASLIQIYTGLVYQGPGLIIKIKRDLADLLQRDGFNSVAEAVGVDVKLDQPNASAELQNSAAPITPIIS